MNEQAAGRVDDLFHRALELPAYARARWLSAECAGDLALLAEVQGLLDAHALRGGILDAPPRSSGARDPGGPRRIGPYRVIRELGRGGMGVVYLVERDDGHFRMRAALKLLRGGPDAVELRERFHAERQILASLDHPNIAQLLDGGSTDGHLPYLVMEYVEGLPITEYCTKHGVGVEGRLRLFIDVCAAVHHAHRNLVIHRDLKPGNVLVTGEGQVKLLDFGIAKLLNPALSAVPLPVTRTELRVMTPEYASPEQYRGDPLSTASDVYALGVLLYELLAGSRPYELAGRPPQEVGELLLEQEPQRPSAVASGQGERRALQGDLDAIVMMALRKEPARRYGSADLLAADIQRHMDGLPVLAHSGNRRYRAGKFLRRHRGTAAAAALVGASLVAGTAAASWQAAAARRERDRAEVALAQAEQVSSFLMGLFDSGDSDAVAPGFEVTARELLRRGRDQADQLADQPAVQARMLDVIGQMHYRLGDYAEAQQLLERSAAVRRAGAGTAPLELAESLLHLAWVHRSRGELERARELAGETLELRLRELPTDHPELAEAFYELGWVSSLEEQERLYREALGIFERSGGSPERRVAILQALSTNVRRQGRFAEGLEADREALRLAERAFGPEHAETGYAMIHLADHVRDIEFDEAAAERLYRRGLELQTRTFGESHMRLVHGLSSLAELHSRRGDHAEAEALLRRVLAIRTRSVGEEHPSVAGSLVGVAYELAEQGRLEEAEALARDALARFDRIFGPTHPSGVWTAMVLGSVAYRAGRPQEGDSLYRNALDVRLGGPLSTSIAAGEQRREYGKVLIGYRRFAEAEAQLLRSLEILEAAYRGGHPNVQESRRALMELYEAWGKPELVERYRVPPGRFYRH
jgi:serine/threonine-protein kinase